MISVSTIILQTIAAGVGTVGFAVLFGVPRYHLPYTGITGGVGWLAYLLLLRFGVSIMVSTFLSTIVICALARWFSVRRRTPTTVFLLCGIFTLVPGAGIYYTAFHIFMNNSSAAMLEGGKTIRAAIAIAMGIAVVYSIPSRVFGWQLKPVIWSGPAADDSNDSPSETAEPPDDPPEGHPPI